MPINLGVLRGRPQETYLVKSVAGAVNVTLRADEAINQTLELTGAITANINLVFPVGPDDGGMRWLVNNNTTGAFTVTLIGSVGVGVVATQARKAHFVWTGADFVKWTADLA